MSANKLPIPHVSNNAFGGSGVDGATDRSFENASVSEREWVMGEEQGINNSVAYSDGMTTDDLNYTPFKDTLGPEVELFAQYVDTMRTRIDSHPPDQAPSEIAYEMIETYSKIARKRLNEYIDDLARSRNRQEIDGLVCVTDESGEAINARELDQHCKYWEREAQTWDLLLVLSRHRLARDLERTPLEFSKHSSDLNFKELLMEMDHQFKELNILLDWVRDNSPIPDEIIDTRGAGWAYTKQALKLMKRRKQFEDARSQDKRQLVTELDPDARERQGRYIEDEDDVFDENLMRVVFQHLRRGDVPGAMAKCIQVNQYWRAQSLMGGLEAWDVVIDGPKKGACGVQGNRRRELWRRMCYKLATEARQWESAVYGILAGDLDSVLQMCRSWEDHLFAHLNSIIETQYYNFLAINHRVPTTVQRFSIYDAVQHHGGVDSKFLPRIVDTLHHNIIVHDEAREPQRILQGSLISDRLADILAELSRQLDAAKKNSEYEPSIDETDMKGVNISDFRLLRVVVHIVLVLKSLGLGFTSTSQEWRHAEDVIAGYMDALAILGKYELVPLYAGHISKHRASEVMGVILVKVTDEQTRIRLLGLMRNYDIDIPETLRHIMINVFEYTEKRYLQIPLPSWTGILNPTIGIYDAEAVTGEDEALIRALEWMLLVPALKGQMMQDGCTVYTRFLVTGRLAAARELSQRIPSTTLYPKSETVPTGSYNPMDIESPNLSPVLRGPDLSAEHAYATALYMEFETFIHGIIALEGWKKAIHKANDSPTYRAYRDDLRKEYNLVEDHTLPIAKSWLLALMVCPPRSQTKTAQLQYIRNIYIPDLILSLHSVYTDAGRYVDKSLLTQTLELAVIVGSMTKEGQEIVKCFVETGKLREYVTNVAEASKMILGAAQSIQGEESKTDSKPSSGADLRIWNVK